MGIDVSFADHRGVFLLHLLFLIVFIYFLVSVLPLARKLR